MKKVVTKYGTLRIYKKVIKIDANPEEVNRYLRAHGDTEVILDHHIRLELKDGWWYHFEDVTYWDDELELWVRLLHNDGTPLCFGARQTLLEAIWYAWVCILQC